MKIETTLLKAEFPFSIIGRRSFCFRLVMYPERNGVESEFNCLTILIVAGRIANEAIILATIRP